MIIQPMIRSNMCINAHPAGCAADVKRQIDYVLKRKEERKNFPQAPKNVLVLGCSTGYGLASRIAAAFEFGATTIGVSFEKEGSDTPRQKPGTPGFYNNMAFDKEAAKAGLKSITFNGDAFSHEMRDNVIKAVKDLGEKIDLIVYSVASAVRVDPDNGTMYRSVLKPLGTTFSGDTIDVMTGRKAA